jgi:hypothetical protein
MNSNNVSINVHRPRQGCGAECGFQDKEPGGYPSSVIMLNGLTYVNFDEVGPHNGRE